MKRFVVMLLLIGFGLIGCQTAVSTPEPTAVLPTALPPTPTLQPTATAAIAEALSSDFLCSDAAIAELVLIDLQEAIANRDGALLASLVHPEDGLRVRTHWWNSEQYFSRSQAESVFDDVTSYEWGVADGTGDPIIGSFAEVIVPLLDQDLLGATETGCDTIVSGGSAGLIQLPPGYAPDRFVSFYRPGTDEFAGMDWGSWAVGIGYVGERPYLTFFIHFDWEI